MERLHTYISYLRHAFERRSPWVTSSAIASPVRDWAICLSILILLCLGGLVYSSAVYARISADDGHVAGGGVLRPALDAQKLGEILSSFRIRKEEHEKFRTAAPSVVDPSR